MSEEMRIEQWPLEKLAPYARNPRKNDDAVVRMADAIKQFGFRVPVVARSSGELIDGHLRLKAAAALGLKTVPVAIADDMTEAQIKAFRISVNKAAEWAGWDESLLALELQELKDMDFDLCMTGFSDDELKKLLGTEEVKISESREIEVEDFNDEEFEHECPRCKFRFND